jgi:arginyl-tRNA--protein-N-Asp/Glu arginylyltransferase
MVRLQMTSPLSIGQLRALYERISEDTRKKQRQLEKLNEYHGLRHKRGGSKDQSVPYNHSMNSEASIHSQTVSSDARKFGHLRADLVKIADKLNVANDLDT